VGVLLWAWSHYDGSRAASAFGFKLINNSYISVLVFALALLLGCGAAGSGAPEGFSESEWRREKAARPSLAQAHLWIDREAARRKQRDLAVVACYRAYALSHADSEGILGDMPRRKRYFHQINTTWLPELALKAQRGEGWFGSMLAQELEDSARRCWNPRAAAELQEAARRIRAL